MRKPLMPAMALAVVAVSLTAGQASAQVKAANDVKAAIENGIAVFAKGMDSGNYAEIIALYADDAIVLTSGAPMVKGKAAIADFWNGMAAAKPSDVKLVTDQVEVHGDVAIETGTYSLKVTPPGATEAVDDVGKYLVVWKRQKDGSWKIYRDSFSADKEGH